MVVVVPSNSTHSSLSVHTHLCGKSMTVLDSQSCSILKQSQSNSSIQSVGEHNSLRSSHPQSCRAPSVLTASQYSLTSKHMHGLLGSASGILSSHSGASTAIHLSFIPLSVSHAHDKSPRGRALDIHSSSLFEQKQLVSASSPSQIPVFVVYIN